MHAWSTVKGDAHSAVMMRTRVALRIVPNFIKLNEGSVRWWYHSRFNTTMPEQNSLNSALLSVECRCANERRMRGSESSTVMANCGGGHNSGAHRPSAGGEGHDHTNTSWHLHISEHRGKRMAQSGFSEECYSNRPDYPAP